MDFPFLFFNRQTYSKRGTHPAFREVLDKLVLVSLWASSQVSELMHRQYEVSQKLPGVDW